MIVAVSMMRRRPDITVEQFRRHWLHPHGTMTAELPGVHDYWQGHLEDTPPTNEAAARLNLNGFPVLTFASLEDRNKAYNSDRIRECNKDSEHFVGAVKRLVTNCLDPIPNEGEWGAAKLYLLKTGGGGQDPNWSAAIERVASALPGMRAKLRHDIISQAGPPESRIPTLDIEVTGFAEIWLDALPTREAVDGALNAAGLNSSEIAVWHARDHVLS